MIDAEFENKVIDSLESRHRVSVKQKMMSNKELDEKEDMAIVNAVIQTVFDAFGISKSGLKFFEPLGEILKRKFPQSYGSQVGVNCEFGILKIPKPKGN